MIVFLNNLKKHLFALRTGSIMKSTATVIAMILAGTCLLSAQKQMPKTTLQLADEYFAKGEYYTAAELYNQHLNPPKGQKPISDFPLNAKGKRLSGANNTPPHAILFKQAECYRLSHYWQKAAACYKECTEKYATQYPEALYWYAVCERSLGDHTGAEKSIQEYLVNAGTNSKFKEAAEMELHTLDFIRQQLARPDSVLVTMNKLTAPNSSDIGSYAPVHVSGNQFLVSSTLSIPMQAKEINPNQSRLVYATLRENNLEDITPLAFPVGGALINQGAATISNNGNHLYLTQWKKGNGGTVSSIHYSVKETEGWSEPKSLPLVNVTGYNSKQPFCSSDGKYLFFASDRPGGSGQFDIWYAPMNSDGTTGEPVNAGSTINTAGDDLAPFYHNTTSTLVFSSNGKLGMGGYDLFMSKGSETTWTAPENMGHPVNSPRDDIYFFSPEKAALLTNAIFSSDRGNGCCLESYMISKAPKSMRLSGIVRDCVDNMPIPNASLLIKDGSGEKTLTTDAEGKYMFMLNSKSEDISFMIQKELYLDKSTNIRIISTDESDLLTDKFTNEDICLEKKPEEKPQEEIIVIKAEDVVTVYFDFDKSILKTEVVRKLDSIYTVLVENPSATIQISGYTDGLGTEEYNNKLSDRRARACANYLLKKGIEAERIRFVSFGACCPVEMEKINGRDNPEGRSLNRRALINVKKE
jgi:OOP family OmpA-OmpF porin